MLFCCCCRVRVFSVLTVMFSNFFEKNKTIQVLQQRSKSESFSQKECVSKCVTSLKLEDENVFSLKS